MSTKEKILVAAQDLIQTRSFHGFSFQDLANRVGIRKPSLYHYFDSKDAIALAVLERAADWVRAQMAKVDGEDPAARLERYFEMFRDIHGKGERMCPGGSFASVFGGVSSSVQSALHRFTKLHLDLLESIVREEKIATSVSAGLYAFQRVGVFAMQATVKPGVDPDKLVDLIGGATLLALLQKPEELVGPAWVDDIAAILLRGVVVHPES